MRIDTVVRRLKKHKPTNRREFQKLFRLKSIGQGCFRDVYRVVGLPLVVKFPLYHPRAMGAMSRSVRHARAECRSFIELRRKRRLLKHLPEIFYADTANAIIVMRLYKPNKVRAGVRLRDFNVLASKVRRYCGSCDMHKKNILVDDNGVFKITDLGC